MSPARRILIVDDESTLTGLLKRLLERKCPYEVTVENDPAQALAVAVDFQPQLVLLDVIMPGLSGGDVATRLRKEKATQHIPIVFISAIAGPVAGYPFLPKPAALEAVIECIEKNALPMGSCNDA